MLLLLKSNLEQKYYQPVRMNPRALLFVARIRFFLQKPTRKIKAVSSQNTISTPRNDWLSFEKLINLPGDEG